VGAEGQQQLGSEAAPCSQNERLGLVSLGRDGLEALDETVPGCGIGVLFAVEVDEEGRGACGGGRQLEPFLLHN
jgi:hypothetical protein